MKYMYNKNILRYGDDTLESFKVLNKKIKCSDLIEVFKYIFRLLKIVIFFIQNII